jgi:ATP-binding cassette subfamily C protein
VSDDRLPIASAGQTWTWLRRQLAARRLEVALTVLAGLLAAAASVVERNDIGRWFEAQLADLATT